MFILFLVSEHEFVLMLLSSTAYAFPVRTNLRILLLHRDIHILHRLPEHGLRLGQIMDDCVCLLRSLANLVSDVHVIHILRLFKQQVRVGEQVVESNKLSVSLEAWSKLRCNGL